MRQVFLRLEGENPIVINALPVTFSITEIEDYFTWEIPLPEQDVTIVCFYPSTPTEGMLEKLTNAAKKYMLDE